MNFKTFLAQLVANDGSVSSNHLVKIAKVAQDEYQDRLHASTDADIDYCYQPLLDFIKSISKEMRADNEALDSSNVTELAEKYDELLRFIYHDELEIAICEFSGRLTNGIRHARKFGNLQSESDIDPKRLASWKEITSFWVDDFEHRWSNQITAHYEIHKNQL